MGKSKVKKVITSRSGIEKMNKAIAIPSTLTDGERIFSIQRWQTDTGEGDSAVCITATFTVVEEIEKWEE